MPVKMRSDIANDIANDMAVPPNFCYPIHDLSNERIKLTAFVVSRTVLGLHSSQACANADPTGLLVYTSPRSI